MRFHIRDDVADQLLVGRGGVRRIEGLAPGRAREILRHCRDDVGLGVRDHHDHRHDLLLGQQIVEDLRRPALGGPGPHRVAEAVIQVQHRQRYRAVAIARRRPHQHLPFGAQRLAGQGHDPQVAMRHRPGVDDAARHQDQAAVDLALRLRRVAAGVGGRKPSTLK